MVLNWEISQVLSTDHQIRNCIGQLFLNTIITASAIFVHSSEGSDPIYCSVWQGWDTISIENEFWKVLAALV